MLGMTIEVRVARPDEYEEVGRLTAAGYRADDLLSRADGAEDHYEAVLLDAARRAGEAHVLVAADDGVLLGTVTWSPPGSPWRELARGPKQGEFRMLAVAPAGRRRGAGRALALECLRRATTAGMREVLISSLPQMTKAHGLYASLGFARDPSLDHSPVPGVHLWGFRLRLAPATT